MKTALRHRPLLGAWSFTRFGLQLQPFSGRHQAL
jgi:hypothetical protein